MRATGPTYFFLSYCHNGDSWYINMNYENDKPADLSQRRLTEMKIMLEHPVPIWMVIKSLCCGRL